jgi:hypothetical protein
MIRPLSLSLVALMLVATPVSAQGTVSRDIDSELARLRVEPTVRDVQEAALQYFRVNQDQVDSMRTRARSKALAPVLEISGGYTQSKLDDVSTNSYLNFQDFNNPWIVRGSAGAGWNVRGKATLNLPRLIFNPEELDVASLAGLVEGILKESTRLYYMRKRLQVDMILKPPTDQATMLSKQLRIEELTAMLDAMTGGWYQNALDATPRGATYVAPKGSRTRALAAPSTTRLTTPTAIHQRDLRLTTPTAMPQQDLRLTPDAVAP